jgi:ferredoxin
MGLNKYTEDDYCDIYANKICDNCGDCLKECGVDVKAIRIEDIAKTVEENKFLEEEYKKMLEVLEDEKASVNEDSFEVTYSNEEYIDAFDNIEYIDDLDIFNDEDLDEITEEIFPGIRRYKG